MDEKVINVFVLENGDYIVNDRTFRCANVIIDELKAICPEARVIIDCGAGNGQFALCAFDAWKNAEIHSFEPVPKFLAEMRRRTGGQARHYTYGVALSDRIGRATLNLKKFGMSNSLLGFLPGNPLGDGLDVVVTVDVETSTLER